MLNLNDLDDSIKLRAITELLELTDTGHSVDEVSLLAYMKKIKYGNTISEILAPILDNKFETSLDELHPIALNQFGLTRLKLLSQKASEILKEDEFFNKK